MPGFDFASATTPPELPGEVLPLVGYSAFWLWLGIGFIALVVVYYLLVWVFTRDPSRTNEAEHDETIDVDAARAQAFARVDTIERQASSGELDDRSAYEQLSATMREFVAEATGVPADHMTLADLSRTQLQGTTRTVAQLYPGIFAPEAQRDVAAATRDARAVISGWN
ncbi:MULTISPECIES: hypothetical protein [Gulosibacter]|uniref:hypothetical protein n=1 Tax=Gulosibacter TaxID=256818 RepID=UPI000F62E6D4|nr:MULTISPECIES: hypothetical protein [Gulosibacter]